MSVETPSGIQVTADPAQALQSLAGLSPQSVQNANVESVAISNAMSRMYAQKHSPPTPTLAPMDQWPEQQQGPLPTALQGRMPAPSPFRMMPVESSTLEMVGYDAPKGQLHIQFKSAPDTYIYSNVEPHTFAGLMNAPSKGLYHSQVLKGNKKYPFVKQRPIPPQL